MPQTNQQMSNLTSFYSSIASNSLIQSAQVVNRLTQLTALVPDFVSHYSSLPFPLIQSMQITSDFVSHLTPPAFFWNLVAVQHLTDYLHWYEGFVASYERDLEVAGETDEWRLSYVREKGMPSLHALADRLHVEGEQQLQTLGRVLRGFRSLAEAAKGLEEGGEFLFILVEDVIERLSDLGLVNQPTHQAQEGYDLFRATYVLLKQTSSQHAPLLLERETFAASLRFSTEGKHPIEMEILAA